MSQPFIVVGDKIDHGGVVVSGTATTDINGLRVARINDKVSCSQHGVTVIASGDPTVIIDGQPVARHGDKTACGATLISGTQSQVLIDTGGGSGSALTRGTAAAGASVVTALQESAAQAWVHDEQIQFVNANGANGANLADVSYTLHLEDGVVVSGQTDAEGRSERVSTTAPVRIVRAELKARAASCCAMHAQQSGTAATLNIDIGDVTTNPVDVGSSAAVVTTPAGEARGLTNGEIAISRQVLADSIDYAKVKIHSGEYLWFGMQPDDTAMTPNGEMYFNEKHFLEDLSAARGTERHWLMHEMVHVWQHQLGYPVKASGAIRIGLSYEYTLASDKRLSDYNMEAQGNILADVGAQGLDSDEKVNVAAIEVSGVTSLRAVTSTQWLAGFIDSSPVLSVTPSTCIVYGKPMVEYQGEKAEPLETGVRYALGMNAHVWRNERWENMMFQAYFCIASDETSGTPRVRQVEWDDQSKQWRWDECDLDGPESKP